MFTSIRHRLTNEPFVGWVLPRAAALLMVLCCFKAALLLNVHSDLVETHWRIVSFNPRWLDWLNFGVFGALVFAGSAQFAHKSSSASPWVIRRTNLALIALGCGFVFFAFHRMELAYLQSVMWGILSLHDVRSYLVFDSFFNPPFLAAYFFGYALVYWILVRTKREHWSFYILGGIAVAYLVLNLRELVIYRDALLVINCFGIASLATLFFSRKPVHPAVMLFPALLFAAGFWMFSAKAATPISNPYFVLLLSTALLLFAGIWFAGRHSKLESGIRNVIFFWFVAFVLLTNRHYPVSNNFDYLIAYSMALPHYALSEVLSVALTGVFTFLIALWFPRLARCLFYFCGVFLVIVGFVDFEVTRTLGIRLDWSVLTMSDNPALAWKTIQPYFTSVAWIGALGLAGFFCTGAFAATETTRSFVRRFHTSSTAYVAILAVLFCLVGSLVVQRDKAEGFAIAHVVGSSPLAGIFSDKRIDHEQFFKMGEGLALLPVAGQARQAATTSNRLNVVLVVMESSYNKYLSLFGAQDETQPLLKKYRDRMELFPNFYSVYPNSFHARFAVLSGLYPTREYVSSVNPRIEAPSLFELLHGAGYVNDVFQSDPRQYVGFADYIGHRRLDHWFDCSNMPAKQESDRVSWGVEEKLTLQAMRQQIAGHRKKNERFFLSYFPVAPHMPYDTPSKEFDKFPSGNEKFTQDYSGRYKNQLLYMDWILTTLLDTLAEEELLDETLVIITNDHGEMVGDQDEQHHLGHGWSLQPELCNTPLIIMNPNAKGYRVNNTLGGQVDVLPTMAELLGLKLPNGELYQGQSLYSAGADRTIYLNSAQHRAMVRGSKYFLEARSHGSSEYPTHVFDISNEGTKTIFKRSGETADVRRELDSFERYQNALIAFYSDYRKAFAQLPQAPKPAVAAR